MTTNKFSNVVIPDREPDFISKHAKYWFNELIHYNNTVNVKGTLKIGDNDILFGDDEDCPGDFTEFNDYIQEAYKNWLVEGILLGEDDARASTR